MMTESIIQKPKVKYDEMSDTLNVTFKSGIKATGITITDHILLRYDFESHRPIGLHFMDYSVLAQPTVMGLQSFPVTGLADYSNDEREEILRTLLAEPVNQFLNLSAYAIAGLERIPIISIKSLQVETTCA